MYVCTTKETYNGISPPLVHSSVGGQRCRFGLSIHFRINDITSIFLLRRICYIQHLTLLLPPIAVAILFGKRTVALLGWLTDWLLCFLNLASGH